MSKSDHELNTLFNDLKKEDNQVEIPPFEGLYKRKSVLKRLFIPTGIAASFLILVGFYMHSSKQENMLEDQYAVEIDIQIEELGTYSLISQQTNVYSWEAPSNSLINDYHEW